MSLQMILGNSGAGKTQFLYDEIIKQSLLYPEKNFLVLVPEQYTMSTQKELVKRHPRGGILNIDVLSLGRLAHRIFAELGVTTGVILDDEGKNLVLRKISKNMEGDLKVLGKNMKKFGYISEVKSLISEFSQYDLGVENLSTLLSQLSNDERQKDSMLSLKLRDIEKIYGEYKEYLEGKYITGEEQLESLRGLVAQSEILKNSIITLDGFTGFTPVQSRLLGELLKIVETMYVTVIIDEKNSKEVYKGDCEVFALSKEMIETLNRLAIENGVEIQKPITMFEENRRHIIAPDLAFLEKGLFRYTKEKFIDTPENLHIEGAMSPWDESLWVAHKLRNLVRKEGYRYSDIAIVSSDMNVYDGYIKRALQAYDIPVFSDTKRSVLLNSFVEYLRSLLEMIDSNYTYQETFRFLKAGMNIGKSQEGTGKQEGLFSYGIFSEEVVDKLENHVLKYGIKGFKSWQQPWGLGCKPEEENQYEYLNSQRVAFVEHVNLLHGTLKQTRKSVEDICRGLYTFFEEQNLQEKIEYRRGYFAEIGELSLEKEYSQIYGIILELMDKFVGILGDEKVSLREYIELLDAGLEEARIGIIPPSTDCVIFGDLQRTRVDHIKALFYVGVSDLYVPGKLNDGGLLSQNEREKLATLQVKLKPSSKVQMYLQKFYLYLVLTKPSEKLYISYAKSNSLGKSARPAYIINELLQMFPELKIKTEKPNLETLELTPKIGLDHILEGFKNKDMSKVKEWQELYTWYMDNEHENKHAKSYCEKIELMKEGLYYKRLEMALPDKLAKDLYGQLLKNSVSRLEKYAACPYAHFLNYGLRLKEREVYEFQASDIGTVLHDAMEDYARRVEETGRLWGDLSPEERFIWAEEAIDNRVANYNHQVFQKTARDTYMVHRMKRLMHRSIWAMTEQLSCGDFVPKGFELSFGFPDDEKMSGEVELYPDTKMQLRGKIDRVDLWEDDEKILVKVVDYKTGKKELSLESMYHGLQLQLFVYLDAAVKHYSNESKISGAKAKEVLPGAAFYYRVDDPLVVEKQGEIIEENILHKLNLDGLVNDGAIHLMDKEMEGKSYALPVSKTSKGVLSKTSKNIPQEQLLELMDFTKGKVKDLGREIVGGKIDIHPYKKGDETGCDYCKYHNICGFDTTIGTYEYRELATMKKEEVLETIRKKEGGK